MANVVSTVQYNTVQYSTVQYSTVQYSTAQHPESRQPGPGQLFSVTAMSLLHRQFGGVKEKEEEEKLPFCWLALLRLAGCEQKIHYAQNAMHYILSVSKITYPLGSLGNNKETQQAPEPSSSDYIIVTC